MTSLATYGPGNPQLEARLQERARGKCDLSPKIRILWHFMQDPRRSSPLLMNKILGFQPAKEIIKKHLMLIKMLIVI
jgi:hypothetical protein